MLHARNWNRGGGCGPLSPPPTGAPFDNVAPMELRNRRMSGSNISSLPPGPATAPGAATADMVPFCMGTAPSVVTTYRSQLNCE